MGSLNSHFIVMSDEYFWNDWPLPLARKAWHFYWDEILGIVKTRPLAVYLVMANGRAIYNVYAKIPFCRMRKYVIPSRLFSRIAEVKVSE